MPFQVNDQHGSAMPILLREVYSFRFDRLQDFGDRFTCCPLAHGSIKRLMREK